MKSKSAAEAGRGPSGLAPGRTLTRNGKAKRRGRCGLREKDSPNPPDDRYRTLFDANPTPMWIYDLETLRFLEVNAAAIAQYGYSREEFLARTARDIRPGQQLAQFQQLYLQEGGAGFRGRWRHLRKDGTTIFVSIYTSPLTFGGRPARLVVTTDVTEQQVADEKIRQSEANLALAQRVARIGSWEVALTNREERANHPPHWSNETFRIFGLDAATTKVTHDSFFRLLHPDEREKARTTFLQQLHTGESCKMDHRIIRPDGSERVVHVQSDTLRDAAGRMVKVGGTVQDLTEQRHAEQLLHQQARLINLASDAIFVRNLDGTVRTWNQGAEHLYGWTAEEMCGRQTRNLIYDDPVPYDDATEELLRTGEWRGEMTHLCKDGRKVMVSARWTLVRDERDEPESILIIHTDVTEQKKLEAQFLRSQRLESIGTLAAGVAHDLNNILAPILLVTPLLRGDLEGAEKESFLALVQTSAERGANLVKQMVTFARGADGERVLVQPSHLIEEVVKIAGQTFPKTITLRTKYPRDLWMVEVDPTQLQQVLLNLCVNARDAMPDGGVLRLTSENFTVDEHYANMAAGARPGPHVLIQVTDDGKGIPRHVIDKIFDPFFTTKEVGKGTGLGLSTVIGIVKSYGGFVNVYSERGHTCFKVFLPASQVASAAEDCRDAPCVPNGRGEKILIVDDEPCIRAAAEALLERWGYEPLVAEDGVSALALYAQQPKEIALVLTDLVMPLMDGLMLIRALRKLNPKQKIILSTGREDDLESSEIRSLGVDACLMKPHSREKLLNTLEETLRCEPVIA
ncbi:MAG TPA: PAS domain S-box protein [Chthoniobacterales bacterium]|nr:PAS domain S-box protein [Chthoniobacterales bacterium]